MGNIKVYFSDFFEIDEDIIEEYGAKTSEEVAEFTKPVEETKPEVVETVPEITEPAPEEKPKSTNMLPAILTLIVLACGGGFFVFKKVQEKKKEQEARFIPVPAFQTAEAMDELCRQFLEAWNTDKIDRLLLIPMFILDFLCIHPFNDGNGRMSRLLSLLLYYKAGYIVGKYVSMEMLIEKTKETYYEALQASSTGWHENENSYEPFLKYYLGITLKAYNEFESRVEHLKNRTLSKPERIKAMIDQKVGKITKKEIMDAHPDISKTTVERTLTDLVKSEYIAKVGSGPATGYVKI